MSDHQDVIHSATILGRCNVHSISAYHVSPAAGLLGCCAAGLLRGAAGQQDAACGGRRMGPNNAAGMPEAGWLRILSVCLPCPALCRTWRSSGPRCGDSSSSWQQQQLAAGAVAGAAAAVAPGSRHRQMYCPAFQRSRAAAACQPRRCCAMAASPAACLLTTRSAVRLPAVYPLVLLCLLCRTISRDSSSRSSRKSSTQSELPFHSAASKPAGQQVGTAACVQ